MRAPSLNPPSLSCPLSAPHPQLGESGPPLNSHLPPDQGSPFAQEMLEDCRQASPFYPGSFGTGAPSPGSSDVSTAGEPSGICPQPPLPRCPEHWRPALDPGLSGRTRRGSLWPAPPGTGASQSPQASDSGGSDVDLDALDSKLFSGGERREPPGPRGCSSGSAQGLAPCPHPLRVFLEGGRPPAAPIPPSPDLPPLPTDGFPDYKKGDLKHGKRKRGRPRKLSKDSQECLEGKKSKQGEKGPCTVGGPCTAGGSCTVRGTLHGWGPWWGRWVLSPELGPLHVPVHGARVRVVTARWQGLAGPSWCLWRWSRPRVGLGSRLPAHPLSCLRDTLAGGCWAGSGRDSGSAAGRPIHRGPCRGSPSTHQVPVPWPWPLRGLLPPEPPGGPPQLLLICTCTPPTRTGPVCFLGSFFPGSRPIVSQARASSVVLHLLSSHHLLLYLLFYCDPSKL